MDGFLFNAWGLVASVARDFVKRPLDSQRLIGHVRAPGATRPQVRI
jgi:hypothetical protein